LIVNYGSSSGDSNFTSYTATGTNVTYSLGFNFLYQSSVYTTIQVNANGYVFLNNSVFISAYTQLFCTNWTGAVYSRTLTTAADLATVTSKVLAAYSNYSLVFTATQGFVITWYNMVPVSGAGQLNTFQMILVSDNTTSFIIFDYVRLDTASMASCAYTTTSNSSLIVIGSAQNCTQGGSFVALVNAGSKIILLK
jgi:hypothetical protein